MKKRLLTAAFFVGAWGAYSQVGIGTLTPNNASQLDVVAKDKGVLIPRVALKSTTDVTTVANANNSSYENSLLVFNTNTQNNITPGYYYWYVDKWMRIVNEQDVISLDKNTTNTSFSLLNGDLILTDTDGNTVQIPLTQINILTNLVYDTATGIATYTNEAGTPQTLDLGAMVPNFETLTTIAVNNAAGMLTYVDEDGVTNTLNLGDLVKAQETLTNLVYNETTGIATYTNEAGTPQTLDLKAIVKNFETLTTVSVDNAAGTLTYKDEAGNTNVLNLGDLVK